MMYNLVRLKKEVFFKQKLFVPLCSSVEKCYYIKAKMKFHYRPNIMICIFPVAHNDNFTNY